MIRTKRVYSEASLRDGVRILVDRVLASLNGEKTWRRARRSANGSDINPLDGPSFAGDTERS